jgi:1,4-alpha-glucan branching enzyme
MYHDRFLTIRNTYLAYGRNLVGAFRRFQELNRIEIITVAATHALLPLMADRPESIRAQVLVARDSYRSCFGCDPRGIWLPECAYVEGIERVLQEANIRWFTSEAHGVLHARPRPRYGVFAPIFTPNGIAVFGRDLDSAKQVWSKHEGYPGDARYRDFYRDIAFDLDLDYIKPYLPAPDQRSFTGIKYHRITGSTFEKEPYNRRIALEAAAEHAQHFLEGRMEQIRRVAEIMGRPPILVAPYDAELFGHWWYEGPEFLDYFFRKTFFDQNTFSLITPSQFLQRHPTHQVAQPSPSSWGEEGYWRVWLNESNEWIYPHLEIAEERMANLARRFPEATGLTERALKQAGRELLLAQASDWPFILRTGTSPDYATKRFKSHILRFIALHDQLTSTSVDEPWLSEIEKLDNIFPDLNYRYWSSP